MSGANSYVWRDLIRNPRRTLAALVGVTLGIGLFSGVLFFIDGSGASMTQRAIAPLAIDMQRVLSAPLGGGLQLSEKQSASGPLKAGGRATFTLVVANRGAAPANEVVVNDEPPAPLTYVAGSATLDGKPLRDQGGRIPLAQGLARTGLNIGTIPAGKSARLTYLARAARAVGDARRLALPGRISSREDVIPKAANAAQQVGVEQLAARVHRIPGVAAADGLAFVDLPAGSLSSGSASVHDTVRVFGFDPAYAQHYPSIRIVAGRLRHGGAGLSAEASRALSGRAGANVSLRLPGRPAPVPLQVSAITDLSRAKPLFYSRKSTDLEAFLYLPNSIVVDLATFRRVVMPAFRAATATQGHALKSLPLLEVDVQARRSRLQSDPGTALGQTKAIARSVRSVAASQDYLIDNISNSLQVARDDAAVAKRMFLFLGLPGALLAGFLAAFAGGILASAQRREQAILRIRGADQRHLLRMLVYRTLALAGAGSLIGTGLGLLSVLVILGAGPLFEASAGSLLVSALISVGIGTLTTGLALYLPGRRSLRREIHEQRGEMALGAAPAWRRLRLDFVLLAATVAGEVVALRTGAFDAPPGSVYEGRAVSLPSHLLLAPIGVWVAGMLLALRGFDALARRAPVPASPRFGSPVWGSLARSLRRRSWSLAGGMVAVGLVVSLGTSLAIFATTYDAAKAADARFSVGSDVRVTPSILSTRPQPPGFARKLEVPGVAAATPVVFKPQNAVLTSTFGEDRESLAAIDPSSFGAVAALSDRFFVGQSASAALAALRRDPRAVLIDAKTADDLKIAQGDKVRVLLARGTKQQRLVTVRAAGFFTRFAGFPEGVNVVADLRTYEAATRLPGVDFFLARSADPSAPGVDRAVAAMRTGPGRRSPLNIDTTRTSLDKDQSSLTAVNVRGLLDLDRFFTLLIAAAGIGIFVFGLMLQRRREYVTMRAQGMQTRELRALVLGETAVVTGCGMLAGVAIGTGMGFLLVHVLRPLFILAPGVSLSIIGTATLVALVLAATLASAFAATDLLRRLRPTELLREA